MPDSSHFHISLPTKKVCLCLFLLCAAFYSAFVVVPFISLMSYKYCYYFQVIFEPSLTLLRVLFAGSGSPKAFHELVFICSFLMLSRHILQLLLLIMTSEVLRFSFVSFARLTLFMF